MAPIAFDIGDDVIPFAKPNRGKRIAASLAGVAAIAAFVAVAVNVGGGQPTEPAAAAPAPAAQPFKSRAYQVDESAPLKLESSSGLTELTVRERSEQDKATQAKAKPSSRRAPKQRKWRRPKPSSKSKTPFGKSTGKGSDFDPLNDSL